jgi:outer membrane protein assembly factor BamE (lipoprotein component of BamABCDE complex)
LLAGCAGTNFHRPEQGHLVIGKSTSADVLRVMGEPRTTGEALHNEKKVKVYRYAFAATTGEPLYPGVMPARAMVFSTANDVLVRQQFLSSFKSDSTEFDDAKIPAITKGKTTRAEVLALLGRPTGEAVYPILKEQGRTAVTYGYAQAKGTLFNMKFHQKTLMVSFDGKDVVEDVQYTSAGEK